MDEAEAARYLEQRVPIPPAIRGHFDGANDLPRWQAASTFSAAIGLRSDNQPTLVVGLLQVLLEALARAVQDGATAVEGRGVEIAEAVLTHFTVDECLAIADYFGGAHVTLPAGTTLGNVGAVVRKLLGLCIGEPLNAALVAWTSGA